MSKQPRMYHAAAEIAVESRNPKREESRTMAKKTETTKAPPVIAAESEAEEITLESVQEDIGGLTERVAEIRDSLDGFDEDIPQETQDAIVRLGAKVAKMMAEFVDAAKEKPVDLGTNAAGEKREIMPEVPVIGD